MEPITARALCLFVVVSSVFSNVCRACGGRLVHAKLITGAVNVFKDWRARRKVHSIVADEINSLALQMSLLLAVRKVPGPPTVTPFPIAHKPTFGTERYDYFYEKNRDVLCQMPGCGSLKRFDKEVKTATSAEALTGDKMSRTLMECKLLEDRARNGELGKLFKQILLNKKFSQFIKLGR